VLPKRAVEQGWIEVDDVKEVGEVHDDHRGRYECRTHQLAVPGSRAPG
jgi:hypothetical protein